MLTHMKNFFYGAFALSLTTIAGQASESEWSQLDKEVEALSMSLTQGGDGPTLGGRVSTYYTSSSDVMVGADDLGGFILPDARVDLSGSVGEYGYRIQYNFGDGSLGDGGAGLLDAYIEIPVGELKATVGQYRPPILRSGLTHGNRLAFAQRSELGLLFSGRDAGGMLAGNFDAIGWWLAVMNGGAANTGDELMVAGRVAFDFLGAGAGDSEGSYGASDDPSGTVAAAFFADGESDGDGFVVEAAIATSVYSVSFELAALGGDLATELYVPGAAMPLSTVEGDSSPFSIAGTYMLQPDVWELGARFQTVDNAADTTKIDVAVTRFVQGHDLKYQAQFSQSDSDPGGFDGSVILLGMMLSF
ncbi:MAG: hypothetical protein ACI8QZ_002092 [Chlamydiales bacterium]